MRHSSLSATLALLAALAAGTLAAAEPARRALVIANSRYQYLPAPADETGARAIAASLEALRFTDTVTLFNLQQSEFGRSIQEKFLNGLKEGDVCFIYYSGYAVSYQSENFLLPADFNPAGKEELYEMGYGLAKLLEELDKKKLRFYVIALEANWENDALTLRAGGTGLGYPSKRAPNSIIAFSNTKDATNKPVAAGQVAPFTAALAAALPIEGTMTTVFRQVRSQAGGAQQPDVLYGTDSADACFKCPAAGPTAADIARIEADQKRKLEEAKQQFLAEEEKKRKAQEEIDRKNKEAEAAARKEEEERRKNDIHGRKETNLTDREEYIGIRKGKFLMGCVPDSRCEAVEAPQHPVEIKEQFWMGVTEVEVSKYLRYVQMTNGTKPKAPGLSNPGWKKENHPIVNVSWEEAAAYCKWAGGRLPTEAEWEYAARAGKDNAIYPFDDFAKSRDKANFDGKKGNDTFDATAPVKSFDPNAFGLFDMAGNVWEWVDAPDGPGGKGNVARGGSYASDPQKHLRLSFRAFYNGAQNHVGFRCALPDTAATRARFQAR
jgi:formylglycine-generating enzyme required for sulfatase activity